MKSKILLEVGVKAFIKNGSKFLILKRSKPYPGDTIHKWDIPGGRIIPGEDVKKALKREIKEETGLRLKDVKKILAVTDIKRDGKHTVRVTFKADVYPGKIKLDPSEHSDYRWGSIEELKKLRHDVYLTPVLKEHFS